jgi:hypothetical protein
MKKEKIIYEKGKLKISIVWTKNEIKTFRQIKREVLKE